MLNWLGITFFADTGSCFAFIPSITASNFSSGIDAIFSQREAVCVLIPPAARVSAFVVPLGGITTPPPFPPCFAFSSSRLISPMRRWARSLISAGHDGGTKKPQLDAGAW